MAYDGLIHVVDLNTAARCDAMAAALMRFATYPGEFSARLFGRPCDIGSALGSAVFMVSVMLARRGRAVPGLDVDELMDAADQRVTIC